MEIDFTNFFKMSNCLVVVVQYCETLHSWFHEIFVKKSKSYTLEIMEFYCHNFSQIFRQIDFLQKNLTENWFDEKKIFYVTVNFSFLLSPKKNFVKSTTYLVLLLVKPLLSRNFCQSRVRVNFCNFHTVYSVSVIYVNAYIYFK